MSLYLKEAETPLYRHLFTGGMFFHTYMLRNSSLRDIYPASINAHDRKEKLIAADTQL